MVAEMQSADPQAAETLVVLLTSEGRSAVATLLVAGPQATELVSRCFLPAGRPLAGQPLGRIAFGRWGSAEGGEEVVVSRRAADRIEIHCHGGRAAARAIAASLIALGAREIAWTNWIRASASDPIEAEARLALSQARTERTAWILWDQHEGALRRAIEAIAGYLQTGDANAAIAHIDELLKFSELGRHLTTPWKIVIAGPPNAGKSSLANALLGYERAIVHPTAGTTRDLVAAETAIEGWPIELVDTAGLRTADEPLEAAGIALARQQTAAADLVLAVVDRSRPWGAAEAALAESFPEALWVWNKCDLPRHADFASREAIEVSAMRGDGLERLISAIAARLVPNPPATGQAVPFAAWQVESLVAARALLAKGDLAGAESQLYRLAPPRC